VEGSVRRSGDRIRITAQLVDAVTGAHRWGERYDRQLHDVFAVQDEVARAIVTTLAAHVNRAEIERALLKPPAAWEAYEYYLRGTEAFFLHMSSGTKASLYDARRLLEQSLAVDPGYARAAAMLCLTHYHAYIQPYDGDYLSPAALDRALELAQTAVRLDARLPQAREYRAPVARRSLSRRGGKPLAITSATTIAEQMRDVARDLVPRPLPSSVRHAALRNPNSGLAAAMPSELRP
jgi:adenylate cyclase